MKQLLHFGRQFELFMIKRRLMIHISSQKAFDVKLSQRLMKKENIESIYRD